MNVARARRWILRIFLGLLGLVALAVVAALLVLANLDAGPVKRMIQAQARAAGVELDFAAGGASLGGLHMRDVKVMSPQADRSLAPALISVGSIDGRWSLLSKRVDDVLIKDVVITVVVDEDGKTSFDRFLAGMPKSEPPPPKPLSQALADVLPLGLGARVRIENVKLIAIPRGKGERMEVTGIGATADLATDGKLVAHVGPSEIRAVVGAREAVAGLDGTVTVARNQLDATLDVTLVKQTFSPEVPPVKQVANLVLQARFLPEEKRTQVRVEKLTLLDGAATLQVDALLTDGEPVGAVVPSVTSATCRIDLATIARSVPKELGPLTVDADPLTCRVKELALLPAPKGQLFLDGKIRHLTYRDIDVQGLTLGVDAKPDGDALAAKVLLPVEKVTMPGLSAEGVNVDLTAQRAAGTKDGWPIHVTGTVAAAAVAAPPQRVNGVKLGIDATLKSPRSLDAKLDVDVDKVAAAALVENARLKIAATDIVVADDPMRSTGTITLGGKIARVTQPKGPQLSDLDLSLEAHLGGKAPSSGNLTVAAGRLAVPGLGRDLPPAPARLSLELAKIELDAAEPKKSRVEAKIAAAFGAASVEGTASGTAAAPVWDLTAKTDRFGPARAIAVKTTGSMGEEITQETTVDVGRVATEQASLKGAHIVIASKGTKKKQDATINASLDGVVVQGKTVGSPKLDLTASADLTRPRLEARLTGKSPDTDLRILADIDEKRVLRWEVDGKVAKLGSVSALLPAGPEWKDVTAFVTGRGQVAGAVRAVHDGVPELVANPALAAHGKQSLDLALRGVSYKGAAETSAQVEALSVEASAELGDPMKAMVKVDAPELNGVASGIHLSVKGLTVRLDAVSDRRGAGNAKLVVRAKEIKQSAFAYYPVRDLEIGIAVENDFEKATNLRAGLYNPGAGTKLELTGELDQRVMPSSDAVPGRHSLVVDGLIEQTLDKLDGAPERLRAKGKVTVPFRIESGDLSLFHTRAGLKFADVSVELPQDKIAVSKVDGVLSVIEEIVSGPQGVQMVGRGDSGIYPQLRFSDQAPFLGGDNFLSIGEVRVGTRAFGPMAGNARVDHDVISMDQMEVNALGGKIAGQCLVEARGKDTRISFRGKVTGIRPGGGTGDERLDASAALTMMPYRLGLEGRVEIVRIGKQHLYDLLDVWDPYHADVSANRVRLGLKIGYPKQVRLHFVRGFASLAIELGGLAGAVRIDEIKGIPIGPAMARFLAPVLEGTQ